MRLTAAVLATLVSLLALLTGAIGTPIALGVLRATYVATVPASLGAGVAAQVQVALTNTGDEIWANAGPNPVNLSYHWYDAAGAVIVWDGVRTPLPTVVQPGENVTVTANVLAPARNGPHQLRFALVREGQGWFDPSAPSPVTLVPAFQATLGPIAPTPMLTGVSYPVSVSLTNTGGSAWSSSGANPINVAYHWHDGSGNTTVVWDGARTNLAADVAPGASVTVAANVTAPSAAGTYRLTIDLVREGVGWFESMGGTPTRAQVSVQTVLYAATYVAPGSASAFIGEQKTAAVTITNTGNVAWSSSGANIVNVAYHLHDAQGRTLVWDGARTPLGGDVAPGAARTVNVGYVAPTSVGNYALSIELVREGVAWFSGLGSPAARIPLTVTSGFSAGYAATTTPALGVTGSTLRVSVEVVNYGPRTLTSTGPFPVNLSYHLRNSSGAVVTWEGRRAALPQDIQAGQTLAVPIDVVLPTQAGDYRIEWDLVQEGVSWFSQFNIVTKIEPISVQPGVTFYGKGFGHGVGMSQWGAQGLATGATGTPQTGEQIIAHYYRGTTTSVIAAPGGGMRVLLSAPSSQSSFTCGARYFDGRLANVMSTGGFSVLNEGQNNATIAVAAANVTFQVYANAGVVQVWNQSTATPTKVYEGAGPIVTVPIDPTKPTRIEEKGTYRGNLRFSNLGGSLRVINFVNHDDYVRAVIPLEMPSSWHAQALKAQAYAARSYAFTSYRGTARDYDVTDDQADQCYGGVQMASGRVVETAATDAAVVATAGKVISYNGQVVRAYFSSSSGGYTLDVGCWGGTKTSCTASDPFLVAVADPADLAVLVPGPNPRASWTATFTSSEIRAELLAYRNVDIGTLTSVDVSNQVPAGVGHVISIRFTGTGGTVVVAADGFLRGQLGLRSTMVRLNPF